MYYHYDYEFIHVYIDIHIALCSVGGLETAKILMALNSVNVVSGFGTIPMSLPSKEQHNWSIIIIQYNNNYYSSSSN